jgi:hypothetical protein
LLSRRSRPIEVFVIVAPVSAARLILGRPESDITLAVAVYSVSVYGPERERLVVAFPVDVFGSSPNPLPSAP